MAKDLAKIAAKEQSELARLKKKAAIPYPVYYVALITVVITLMHSMDEMTSKLGDNVRSSVIEEFFIIGRGMDYNQGLQTLNTFTMALFLLQIISPFYKVLADKYGRKLFLIFNVFGMAFGLFMGFISTNLTMYLISGAITGFFVLHDVQIIYILEVAPNDKRSQVYGIVKSIGTFGMFLIPVFMDIFMDGDMSKWRLVYGAGAAVAVVISIVGLLFTRESDVFLKQRIAYLEKPLAEREAEEAAAKVAAKGEKKAIRGGLIGSFKYIFADKDFRWIILSFLLFYVVIMPFAGNAEPIMATSGVDLDGRTQAFYVFPFVYAAIIFVCGYLGDWIGRKNTILLCGVVSLASFIGFVVACGNGWSPLLIGVLYGFYLGCFFTAGDYLQIMMKEKSPTEIRASIGGAVGFLNLVSVMGGMIVFNIMIGSMPISTAAMILAIPFIIVSLVILMLKVKETKGVDLDKIGHED